MKIHRLVLSACGVIAALATNAAASARQAAEETDTDEVIVVTAQKREQLLIDVPQSVSVVGGRQLERHNAYNFQDYAKLVPGLSLAQSNAGEARIVLRGINTGGVAATVASYVDETPFGSSSGQINAAILPGEFDTFDVARVEVLRGPQGTLYGASSLGGVLKFVTQSPNFDRAEARGRAGVETVEGGDLSYLGSAVLNVPLSDKAAIRGSGFYRSYGGYIDSVGTGGSDVASDINMSKSYGGRVSALFKPTETFSMRMTALLQNLDSDAANVVESDPITLAIKGDRLTQSRYVPEITEVAYRLLNASAHLDLGVASLTSSTSFSSLKVGLLDDLTVLHGSLLSLYDEASGPAADIGLVQNTDVERFTQEIRLVSSQSDVVQWLVGGYYNHEKGAIIQRIEVYDQGTLELLHGFSEVFDGATRSGYDEFAGFANGTLHLGPRFDLTLGGRYSHNAQYADQGGTGMLAPPQLDSRSSEDVLTWSVAPKFKFSDTGAIYARIAKGFRPGGPNILPPAAPTAIKTYESDSLVSYEIGLKVEAPDRLFSLDIAAFHIDWSDVQLFAQVGEFGVNANGGKARSSGVEFTAVFRPTHGLTLSGNGAYTNAKLLEDTDLAIIGGRDQDRLPFSPEFSISLNGDYEWALSGSATAYFGGSARHVGDQSGPYSPAYVATNGRQYLIPAYSVVDLRAGAELGHYSIEAYVRNLTDVRGLTNVTGEGNLPGGSVGTGVIRPRAFGVTLTAGF